MSAAAEGGNGPGPGSGPSNPRKFSEKIALHNQRQAEETAAFQEVMMDISSTRLRSSSNMMKFTHLVAWSRIFLFSLLQCPLNSVLVSVSLCLCAVYPYPVPPIEENMLDERKQLLKPWDTKKFPILSSRPKSCEVPGINIFPSPEQHSSSALIPTALNTGGSLPDLTSLHFPSPLPTPLDPDEPHFPSLSGGSSTGNLASTLTQLGFGVESAFHSQGPSSLQGSFSNPSLQSSLSNPNIQSSLSSLPFQTSFSNPSLQSSLKSSLQSSPSNQSLQSSLSNASLLSSVSNSSLGSLSIQSTASNPSYSSGVGSSSSSSSYSPMMMQSQQQPPAVSLSTSPRRRAPLSPLLLPLGGDLRRHHPKQFSPTISPTLSSITQESSLLSSLLDDPYLGMQLTARQTQALSQQLEQFNMESPAGSLSLINNSSGEGGFPGELRLTARQTQALSQQLEQFNMESPAGSLSLSNNSSGGGGFPGELRGQTFSPAESGRLGGSHSNLQDPQLLNKQKQSCTGGRHGNVPSIILTGTCCLALGMLGEADLVLPDPSVEESFRSDRLKPAVYTPCYFTNLLLQQFTGENVPINLEFPSEPIACDTDEIPSRKPSFLPSSARDLRFLQESPPSSPPLLVTSDFFRKALLPPLLCS
ncbi:UNVERIFIED_CONTAM: hypothetical protein FKN15_034410 [Acipenser sinensis]